MILLIVVLKSFLINFILPKNLLNSWEKAIILPFLGHLSFETRNRLNSCIRNQVPSCSLRIAFQSKKLIYLAYLNLKIIFLDTFAFIINFCVVAAMQLTMVKLRDIPWVMEGGLSHFSERSCRRDLGQIGILGGNWHFRWEWFFLGGT